MSQAPADDRNHRTAAKGQAVGPSPTQADDPGADDTTERDLHGDPLADLAVFQLRAEEIIERTRVVGQRTESWLVEQGIQGRRPTDESNADEEPR